MENPGGYEAANKPAEESPPWPKHHIVDTLAELVENVETAPPRATFDVRPPDSDGDVRVDALIVDPPRGVASARVAATTTPNARSWGRSPCVVVRTSSHSECRGYAPVADVHDALLFTDHGAAWTKTRPQV